MCLLAGWSHSGDNEVDTGTVHFEHSTVFTKEMVKPTDISDLT